MTHVLVIDDDARIRDFMRVVLSQAGFCVDVAEGGAKALRTLASAPFDLIITDILMPDGDGIDLILSLRRSACRPKILAISGGGMLPSGEYLESAAMLGADDTLAKPFSGVQLLAKVQELLTPQADAQQASSGQAPLDLP